MGIGKAISAIILVVIESIGRSIADASSPRQSRLLTKRQLAQRFEAIDQSLSASRQISDELTKKHRGRWVRPVSPEETKVSIENGGTKGFYRE